MSILAIVLSTTLGGLLAGVLVLVLGLPSRYSPASKEEPVSVQVLVLGDIGRSPRMQYHALSIARHGGRVDLIGYQESAPHPDLLASPHVKIYALAPPPAILRSGAIPFVVSGPLKVLWQICTLFRALAYRTPAARWLLVQNPPSIPTLLIAQMISVLRTTHLMIDWHNYGWTILANTKGRSHPFVALARAYEIALAQTAPTANVTVTHAMARQLQASPYSVSAPILTLHDRPAALFQPLDTADPGARRAVLARLSVLGADVAESVVKGHMRLLVSSTSWTPDEDFGLLLDALVAYASTSNRRPVVAVITGRGPQKAYYESRVRALEAGGQLPGVRVLTAWLSLADYASLLASADLGVCLHRSSSGVDLPMKVVDMFGAGLPVAAYSGYESFGELVVEGVNGRGFESAEQLAGILARLLDGGAAGAEELAMLREGARREGSRRWDEEWDRVLGRVFGVVDE